MASHTQSNPPESGAATQQSLNILNDTLILKKNRNGGAKSVAGDVPEADPDENISVREMDSEVGKPKVEYPRDRDHCTVSKLKRRKEYRHSSYSTNYEYKVFDVQIDREHHPDEADRLADVIARIRKLSELDAAVDALETYEDLVENAGLVREYEATYRMLKGIWENDSLKSYALEYTARDFRVKQFPQGFYTVPGPHHTNVRQILDEKLQDEGIGKYSVAWGGFIVEPADFTEIYNVVNPVYHTPDTEDALSRQTLN